MFYETRRSSKSLRFGDIVAGFPLAAPHIESPAVERPPETYRVELEHPQYAAVLSPCCSIGSSTLLLSPLVHVWRKWLGNPYLVQDLTRVNRKMAAEQTLAPEDLEKLEDDEKQRRLELAKPAYAFLEQFVYDQHVLLPSYELTWKGNPVSLGHYMIDFRRVHRVNCPAVKSPEKSPLHAKILELSIEARTELRDKLSYYFGRVPQEDEV